MIEVILKAAAVGFILGICFERWIRKKFLKPFLRSRSQLDLHPYEPGGVFND